jgi:DNA polymerase (family 10)
MKNQLVAQIFRDISKILQIKGDNVFRVRAYERAAENIESLSENIDDVVKEERIRDIAGVGRDLAGKVREIVETGKLEFFDRLKKTIPSGLLELLNIPTVGPKTAKLLYEELKIKNIAGLEKAIEKGKLLGLFGIKEKTIENISRGIELLKRARERMPLSVATQTAEEFISAFKKLPQVKKISVAGSLRRQKETVRDIDILMISGQPGRVMEVFTGLKPVKEVLARGKTKSSVRTKDDVQIDCRVVQAKSFGAALLYFTGSKNFNIHLRKMAQAKGLKINEYGIFRQDKYIAGETEEEIFKLLGLSYIEPEMREDNGEVELALKNRLPALIELSDIKGDLHVHSRYSDGSDSIRELAEAGKKRGYSYLAVTDHSQSLKVAGGLSLPELKKKKSEIERVNAGLKNFRILFGTEAEIDSQGRVDYKDEVLKQFDVVVAAIHSGFKQSKEQLTRRIVRACENKYVNIIAHLTGRLWGARDAYDLDFERIFKVARETNTHLEINAFGQRLDLNDINSRRAGQAGVKLAISTDAHNSEQLEAMRLGVSVARRGWLSKENVVNTLSLDGLLRALKK